MRLVLDASAALRLVLEMSEAPWILEQVEQASIISAPELYCLEVSNGLWKYVRSGAFDRDEALELYEMASSFPDILFPSQELAVESLSEGVAHQHSVYDLAYGVLARRTGATVLTTDRSFASLLEKIHIPVLIPAR